jgi:(p)ppGpp synthase/HD superfamily hydrolase
MAGHRGTAQAMPALLLPDVIEDAAVSLSHLRADFETKIATMVERCQLLGKFATLTRLIENLFPRLSRIAFQQLSRLRK